jgi:hypothetical protein
VQDQHAERLIAKVNVGAWAMAETERPASGRLRLARTR